VLRGVSWMRGIGIAEKRVGAKEKSIESSGIESMRASPFSSDGELKQLGNSGSVLSRLDFLVKNPKTCDALWGVLGSLCM